MPRWCRQGHTRGKYYLGDQKGVEIRPAEFLETSARKRIRTELSRIIVCDWLLRKRRPQPPGFEAAGVTAIVPRPLAGSRLPTALTLAPDG